MNETGNGEVSGSRLMTGLRLKPVLAPSEAIQREIKKHLGDGDQSQ